MLVVLGVRIVFGWFFEWADHAARVLFVPIVGMGWDFDDVRWFSGICSCVCRNLLSAWKTSYVGFRKIKKKFSWSFPPINMRSEGPDWGLVHPDGSLTMLSVPDCPHRRGLLLSTAWDQTTSLNAHSSHQKLLKTWIRDSPKRKTAAGRPICRSWFLPSSSSWTRSWWRSRLALWIFWKQLFPIGFGVS